MLRKPVFLTVPLLLLLLSSCFLHKHRRSNEAVEAGTAEARTSETKTQRVRKPTAFQYGRTREEVLADIKDRSEIIVGEFNLPRGHLAVYQYNRYGRSPHKEPGYYLYFMNDTLIRKSVPEDLMEGSELAVRQYYRSRK